MTRKPRKMPKNQRAYPKKGKPRMVEITDANERLAILAGAMDAPHAVDQGEAVYVNANDLRKWRALRNPPTGDASA